MSSKSKNKGKSFEREVCNFLSELYNESFTRVPDSGAFTGGKNSHRRLSLTEGQVRAHKGDIIPPDDWRYFNAECKNYADFPFHQLFSGDRINILESWLEQTMQASDVDDCNFLFMKFNRKGRYLAYQNDVDFDVDIFVNYNDQSGNTWNFCKFENFFKKNKDKLKFKCTHK